MAQAQVREREDKRVEERDEIIAGLEDKISDLLDCVERPTGTLRAVLPQTAESERALVALYDAIGRTL